MKKYIYFVLALVLGSSTSLVAMRRENLPDAGALARLEELKEPAGRSIVMRSPTLDEEKLLRLAIEKPNVGWLQVTLIDKTIDPTTMQIIFRVPGGRAFLYSLLEYAVICLCDNDLDESKKVALSKIITILPGYPFNLNSRFDIECGEGSYARLRMLDLLECYSFRELAQLLQEKGALRSTHERAVRAEIHVEEPEKSWFWRMCCFSCRSAKPKRL